MLKEGMDLNIKMVTMVLVDDMKTPSVGQYLWLSNGWELSSLLGRAARSYLNLEDLNVT